MSSQDATTKDGPPPTVGQQVESKQPAAPVEDVPDPDEDDLDDLDGT